jgi:hypothetical protein
LLIKPHPDLLKKKIIVFVADEGDCHWTVTFVFNPSTTGKTLEHEDNQHCCCVYCYCGYDAYMVAVESFPSCPPPRFDEFGEEILCLWKCDAKQEPGSVKEVRRSCGGAVQGIRESYQGEEDIYLNRANDGFLSWDCGSFVHITIGDLMTTGNILSASLTINEKIRIRISTMLDSTGVRADQISKYLQVSWADKDQTFEDDKFQVDRADGPVDVNWHLCVQCQMASLSQPWMLQRAPWLIDNFADDQHCPPPPVEASILGILESNQSRDRAGVWSCVSKIIFGKRNSSFYGKNGKLQM